MSQLSDDLQSTLPIGELNPDEPTTGLFMNSTSPITGDPCQVEIQGIESLDNNGDVPTYGKVDGEYAFYTGLPPETEVHVAIEI